MGGGVIEFVELVGGTRHMGCGVWVACSSFENHMEYLC
jgi:hypothetical protein